MYIYVTLHYSTSHTSIRTSYASNLPLFCHDSTARRWQVYHCQGLFKTAAVLAHDGQDLIPKLGFCSPEKLGKKTPKNHQTTKATRGHGYAPLLSAYPENFLFLWRIRSKNHKNSLCSAQKTQWKEGLDGLSPFSGSFVVTIRIEALWFTSSPYLLQGNEPSFKDSMVSKRVWRSPWFPCEFQTKRTRSQDQIDQDTQMIMANMLKTKPGSEKAMKPDKNLVLLVVALYQSIKLGKVG